MKFSDLGWRISLCSCPTAPNKPFTIFSLENLDASYAIARVCTFADKRSFSENENVVTRVELASCNCSDLVIVA